MSSFTKKEVVHAGGGKSVFSYDPVSKKKVGSVIYDKDGTPVFKSHVTSDGVRISTDLRTGSSIRISPNGSMTKTSLNGHVRQTSIAEDGSRLVSITRPGGERFSYRTARGNFGSTQVHYYTPNTWTSFDNPWFIAWLVTSNNNDRHSGNTINVQTNSPSGLDLGGSTSSKPMVFSTDWREVFPNLPADAIHVVEYRNPVDWLTDHVINEIISEKAISDNPGFWKKLMHPFSQKAKSPKTEPFEIKGGDRINFANHVSAIVGMMREHKAPKVSDFIDEQTGEIKGKPFLLLAEDIETHDELTKDICKLGEGDLVQVTSFFVGSDEVGVTVTKSSEDPKACKPGTTAAIKISAIQNALNDITQRIERAMQSLHKLRNQRRSNGRTSEAIRSIS
jgi:hypothetical protein